MALTGVAGPVSNLLLAVIFALLVRLEFALCNPMALVSPTTVADHLWFYLLEMLLLGQVGPAWESVALD